MDIWGWRYVKGGAIKGRILSHSLNNITLRTNLVRGFGPVKQYTWMEPTRADKMPREASRAKGPSAGADLQLEPPLERLCFHLKTTAQRDGGDMEGGFECLVPAKSSQSRPGPLQECRPGRARSSPPPQGPCRLEFTLQNAACADKSAPKSAKRGRARTTC